MMKRILSLILTFTIIVTMLVMATPAFADYTPTAGLETLLKYLDEQIGKSYKSNSCQGFVWRSVKTALGVESNKVSGCAVCAWRNHGVSTDRNDIPLGATVYFSGSDVTCGTCGGKAGHVGFYVGDGNYLHAPQSGRTVSIDPLTRDIYCARRVF